MLFYATLSMGLLILFLCFGAMLSSMMPPKDGDFGLVEIDFSTLPEGTHRIIKFDNRPVILIHRSDAQREVARSQLATQEYRPLLNRAFYPTEPITEENSSVFGKGKFLIFNNYTPVFGCVTYYEMGDYDGWFDPCRANHYDLYGGFRKGADGFSLEIPRFHIVDDRRIVLVPRMSNIAPPRIRVQTDSKLTRQY